MPLPLLTMPSKTFLRYYHRTPLLLPLWKLSAWQTSHNDLKSFSNPSLSLSPSASRPSLQQSWYSSSGGSKTPITPSHLYPSHPWMHGSDIYLTQGPCASCSGCLSKPPGRRHQVSMQMPLQCFHFTIGSPSFTTPLPIPFPTPTPPLISWTQPLGWLMSFSSTNALTATSRSCERLTPLPLWATPYQLTLFLVPSCQLTLCMALCDRHLVTLSTLYLFTLPCTDWSWVNAVVMMA